MSETARPVGTVRAIVGESPVWSEADRCVYWVDILGGLVHRYEADVGSNRYWRLPEQVGTSCSFTAVDCSLHWKADCTSSRRRRGI